VTASRSVLFIAEFDDVYHAHAMQRRRALERLDAAVSVFDLKARPSFLERFRAGDLGRRLERCIDEVQPDLILVNGNDAIDEALERLAQIDPRQSRIVELRFFAGLSVEETADVLSVSPETVMRDWRLARAWLRNELS